MAISEFAKDYRKKMFPGYPSDFARTDPEFIERFVNFAFDEVVNQVSGKLDDKTRFMATLATLLGCQGIDAFRAMVPAALNFGLSPVQIKEIVYQSVAYLGIGRVLPFLKATNEAFESRGIALPLEPQATNTAETRVQTGEQAQVDIFGDRFKGYATAGPKETTHINRWLSGNCFGDYYTRKGLTYAEREIITFCFLAAQGGCEPQLTSHAGGNLRIGNDKEFLIAVVSNNVPYIGYPRTLNALRCINAAAVAFEQK